ncbi:MAG: FG-GAP repeat protein [Pseudomonadota bacterium]|nr:FG-GAP repeat protein [Pseudomonadota bacterium]
MGLGFDQLLADAPLHLAPHQLLRVELLAADGAAGDNFGTAVSLSGDRVVVGALRSDDLGTDSGAAYVFRSLDVTDPLPDVKGQRLRRTPCAGRRAGRYSVHASSRWRSRR